MARTQQIGISTEKMAQAYLVQQGLRPLAKNYRSKMGEIDLIMSEAETLVFVEVRYRSSEAYGGALASVDHNKQSKLIKTAYTYLRKKRWQGPCRFDVLAMNNDYECQWVKNAFGE